MFNNLIKKMKNFLLLIFISMLFSCETKTVEIEKKAGIVLNGNNKGKKFVFGSDKDAQIALDMVQAYADREFDKMNELANDTVMFFPDMGGKYIAVAAPANDFLASLHEPYDSIRRFIWNAIPLKFENNDYTNVVVSFQEFKYGKDGTVEKSKVVEKIYVRNGKVFRINQLMGELD